MSCAGVFISWANELTKLSSSHPLCWLFPDCFWGLQLGLGEGGGIYGREEEYQPIPSRQMRLFKTRQLMRDCGERWIVNTARQVGSPYGAIGRFETSPPSSGHLDLEKNKICYPGIPQVAIFMNYCKGCFWLHWLPLVTYLNQLLVTTNF